MDKLDAFKSDVARARPQVRAGPFGREGILEIPPEHRETRLVEQIDRPIQPDYAALDYFLVPEPERVDGGKAMLENQRRPSRPPGKAVNIIVQAPFGVLLRFGFGLQPAHFGEATRQNPLYLDKEIERKVRVDANPRGVAE